MEDCTVLRRLELLTRDLPEKAAMKREKEEKKIITFYLAKYVR